MRGDRSELSRQVERNLCLTRAKARGHGRHRRPKKPDRRLLQLLAVQDRFAFLRLTSLP